MIPTHAWDTPPITHRLYRRAQLTTCVEELELLQIDSKVVVQQVSVLAQQPRVRDCFRCCESLFGVNRQKPADQIL